jgi:type IV pilus assembly protein PilC
MNAPLFVLFQGGALEADMGILPASLLYVVLVLLPLCCLLYLIYFLLTLPLRRNERARLLLDLMELGLKQGRSPENTLVAVAASHDRSLGVRFHLLAAYLEQGLRLSEALKRVPYLLPPQIRDMLATGERIGDVAKVLPACRHFILDGVSRVRSAVNYLVILVFVVTPFSLFVPIVLRLKVFPKFREVFAGMAEGAPMPPFSRLVFGEGHILTLIQLVLLCLLWLGLLAYLAGPRFRAWLRPFMPGLSDWLVCRLPWRWKRLQGDFSAMLAILLDAEVPELEAVALAAEATGNEVMVRRSARVAKLLREGTKLPQAIAAMDDAGELRWRLANALHRRSGFQRALAGWHEALDAKAFQLEQSAAQVTTTCLVLVNGVIVASIVIAVFLVLIEITNQAALW